MHYFSIKFQKLKYICMLAGYLRDISGSYNICIFIINGFTLTTIIIWSIEFTVAAFRKKNKSKKQVVKEHKLNNSTS